MIIINEEFSIQGSPHGWTLHRNYMSRPKDGSEPKKTSRRTYHATLRQACAALIDQSVESCPRARKIVQKLDNLLEELLAHAEENNDE